MRIALLLLAITAGAAEYRGIVTYGAIPVPGVSVTATHATVRAVAVTGQDGAYRFPSLEGEPWTFRVEMPHFAVEQRELASGTAEWRLKLLPLTTTPTQVTDFRPAAPAPQATDTAPKPAAQPAREPTDADDGLLINGSTNNGASLPFALSPAFGNARKGRGSLYNASLGLTLGNSGLDARPYSLTGQDIAKPSYSRFTGLLSFGGPVLVPRLTRNGPNLTLNYQWTRNRAAQTVPALVPTASQREGDLGADGRVPASQISPQAVALLALYPLPNFAGSSRYNYQAALTKGQHQDSLQLRLNQQLGRRNQVSGGFGFESTRTDAADLFGFLDTGSNLGLNARVQWNHHITTRWSVQTGFQFSRMSAVLTPFFAGRRDISAQAGILGNSRNPADWGPPALQFSSGIAPLGDENASATHNQTAALTLGSIWSRNGHNLSFGGDVRRLQFNRVAQQEPRGTLTFTGSSLRNFLLGIPDTASIAFGNADKYFRSWFNDAYFTDDWRVSPGLTINAGARWEYTAPPVEKYNRLVNLDLARGFTAQSHVLAASPTGALTGRGYPRSLVEPDYSAIQPRIGVSWRPFGASSMVVRAGWGFYYDTSIYQQLAARMAQQPPLSKTFSVTGPLTIATAFDTYPAFVPNTFAMDPDFRIGFAQTWQLSIQRDLPWALVVLSTYSGSKGEHSPRAILPNTNPAGAADPCPTCPRGFAYLTSQGVSHRESGSVQLRRRLRAGLTASLQYTFAKALDDSAPGGRGQGGSLIVQDWRNPGADYARSSFDQRHALAVQAQYTTKSTYAQALREWAVALQLNTRTGLPLTPVYLVPLAGTGITGNLRPDYSGAPLYAAPQGAYLNPSAYRAPASGQWGNAGRNSIDGPAQTAMSASIGRTFRRGERLNLDVRFDAANLLNQVNWASWNTVVGSAQFGYPTGANAMRTMQATMRARF